jgi:hypothetical protein
MSASKDYQQYYYPTYRSHDFELLPLRLPYWCQLLMTIIVVKRESVMCKCTTSRSITPKCSFVIECALAVSYFVLPVASLQVVLNRMDRPNASLETVKSTCI